MALFRRERSVDSWQEETNININNSNQVTKGDPLAIIYTEGFWRLHKVSPLQNLRYQPVKLKAYANKVKQGLISIVQAPSAQYNVAFEELPKLKYSESDASGLIITVTITAGNKKPKVSYLAILLSWGVSMVLDRTVHLPYMLEKGEQKIATSIKNTLRTLFDCTIWQCYFTQYHLLQLGFSFIDHDAMSKSSDQFILVYKTPQVDKETVKFSFQLGSIQMIWNGVQDETRTEAEQAKQAYQYIQNHIFDTIMFDVIVCDLTEVKTPKAEVKINGIIKVKTPEMVNCLFLLLNKMIAEQEKDVLDLPMDEV